MRYQFHFVLGIIKCPSIIGTFMFYAFIIASPPSHCLSTFIDDRQQSQFFSFLYLLFSHLEAQKLVCLFTARTPTCPNFSSDCVNSYFHFEGDSIEKTKLLKDFSSRVLRSIKRKATANAYAGLWNNCKLRIGHDEVRSGHR